MNKSNIIAGYVVILEPKNITSRIPFFMGQNIIGRLESAASVVIKETSVSQKHARLVVTPTSMYLTDIGSKNGVKINTDANPILRNKQMTIDQSMMIYFGEVKCRFQRKEVQEIKGNPQPSLKAVGEQVKKINLIEMFFEDEQEQLKHQKQNQEKSQKKKIVTADEFNIQQGFCHENKKNQKAKPSRATKKNLEIKPVQLKEENIVKGKSQKIEKIQKLNEQVKEVSKDKKQNKSKKQGKKETKKLEATAQNDEKQLKDKKESKLIKDSPERYLKIQNKSKDVKKSPIVQKNKGESKEERKQQIKQNPKKSPSKSKDKPATKENNAKEKPSTKENNVKDKPSTKQNNVQEKSISKQNNSKDKSVSKENIAKQKQKNGKLSLKAGDRIFNEETLLSHTSVESGGQTKKRPQNRKRMPSQSLQKQVSAMPLRKSFLNKRILISGFVPQLIKKYFLLVEELDDQFDFLVMKQYKRTFKALYCICKAIPIVKFDWLKESEYFQKTLKPDNYYFDQHPFTYEFIQNIQRGEKVFTGYSFFLGSQNFHLKTEDIQILIYAAGGEVIRKIGKLTEKEKKDSKKIAIVRNYQEKTKAAYNEEIKQMRKLGFERIFSVQLILDSCEQQKIDWSKNQVK